MHTWHWLLPYAQMTLKCIQKHVINTLKYGLNLTEVSSVTFSNFTRGDFRTEVRSNMSVRYNLYLDTH